MIALLGATGYTGIKTARALERRGLPFCIAGRNSSRLEALAGSLESHPDVLVVDLEQNASILEIFKNARVVINCVGPFTDLGERIVRQAAMSGVHYVDPSNELSYVYRMRTYHRLAEKSGAILSPACAFEVALSDCAAARLASQPGPIREIQVVYHLPGAHPSLGTRRSALRTLATSWVAYRGGRWVGQAPTTRAIQVTLDGRRQSAISIPSSESVTFPEHLSVDTVSVWMTVSRFQSIFGPLFAPYFARFLRSIAGPWIQALMGVRAPEPTAMPPENSPFHIQVTAIGADAPRVLSVRGMNPYQVTGEILAHAAGVLLENPPDSRGVLPPSRILGDTFFDVAAQWGVTLTDVEAQHAR